MSKVTHYVTRIKGTSGLEGYEEKEIINKMSEFGEKLADNAFVCAVMSHLLGKVLTTVEATTPSDKQAKAIKDIMRGHFSEELGFVSEMMFDQEKVCAVANAEAEKMTENELAESAVDIDDALKG